MGILRLLLAISVVAFHADKTLFGAKFIGGALAVQMFYIISGFYMSLILNEKYKKGNSTYSLFITNRILRLYPLYFIVIIITMVVFVIDYVYFNQNNNWLGNIILYRNKLNGLSLSYISLSNLLVVGQDLALFLGLDLTSGALFFTKNFKTTSPQVNSFMILGQAWTIGIEIMFYIVAPFIVREKIKVVLLIILISFLTRIYIYYVLQMKYDPWTYRFFPTEIIYFLFGYLAYRAYKYLTRFNLKKIYLFPLWIILSGLTVIYGNIFSLLSDIHIYQTFFHISYMAVFIILLPFIFTLTKKMKIDNQIGELSYPIYLCHSLFLYLDQRLEINSIIFIVFSTILLSIILNFLITKPVEIIRQKRVSRRMVKLSSSRAA